MQFEILKNPGIDFYSGCRKTSQGGGANLIPKKVGPPYPQILDPPLRFVSKLSRQSVSPSTDHELNLWSVDGETDCRDNLLTNLMQNIGE